MSGKNTETLSIGENTTPNKDDKKATAKSTVNIKGADKGPVVIELNKPSDTANNGVVSLVNPETSAGNSTLTGKALAKKSTQTKKVVQTKKDVATIPAKKKAVATSKPVAATNDKKIKLAASCYHYYRNWLKEFMRSHGAPSARFLKSADSYEGHITVLESEKVKGLKALEAWSKENPDTKEMFWDIKK